jgi:hypothetical protein
MTLRMDLAGAAIAALALIMTGITTAHAQSGNCIGGPWRCHYNANGRLYFGAHPRNPDRAAWGCGATDGQVRGRSWNYANRAAASYRALAECARKATQGRCHIVSCRPAVHSSFEAVAIWGPNTQQ